MYEMRQKKIKEMQQKNWFYYALLAAAIFVFSQSSAIIRTNIGFALPAILISFVMHSRSVGNLTERIFKIKASTIPNIAMLICLLAISLFCYFNPLRFSYIILLNLAAIAVYVIAAALFSTFKTGE